MNEERKQKEKFKEEIELEDIKIFGLKQTEILMTQ